MTIPERVPLDFDIDDGFGWRTRIRLIVLESDRTIEAEAHMLGIDSVTQRS